MVLERVTFVAGIVIIHIEDAVELSKISGHVPEVTELRHTVLVDDVRCKGWHGCNRVESVEKNVINKMNSYST